MFHPFILVFGIPSRTKNIYYPQSKTFSPLRRSLKKLWWSQEWSLTIDLRSRNQLPIWVEIARYTETCRQTMIPLDLGPVCLWSANLYAPFSSHTSSNTFLSDWRVVPHGPSVDRRSCTNKRGTGENTNDNQGLLKVHCHSWLCVHTIKMQWNFDSLIHWALPYCLV
jgi:hypothetical protein